MKRYYVLICLLFILSTVLSCERIDQPISAYGDLTTIDLKSIPKEYGKLVSVTTHARYEGWAQLWFVDEESTIRMVRIQFHNNQVHDKVKVIPRN